MSKSRRATRGLVAAAATMTVAVGLLPGSATAAPVTTGLRAAAVDPLPEATTDEKYRASLIVNGGDDYDLHSLEDCDFVHEISVRPAAGAEVVRSAVKAFADGTVSTGSPAFCTNYIRTGIYEANRQDQQNEQNERAARDARQAAAAAIGLDVTPALLGSSNFEFVAQVAVHSEAGTRVKTQAEAAVRANDAAQLSKFIVEDIFKAREQDVLDKIAADAETTEAEKEALRWRSVKANALAQIGVFADESMLARDDKGFVALILSRAVPGSEVAAAATVALASDNAEQIKEFLRTGIYTARELDFDRAQAKQAEANRAAVRVIKAKAENSLVHPALAAAATAALAGNDEAVSKFLREGQHAVTVQTLRTTVAGRNGWYVRASPTSTSVAAEGTGEAKALTDAKWKVVDGLSDPDCASFESVSSPGYYLRESGNGVRLSANDGSNTLKVSATWCPTVGKTGSNVSLESKSKPGRFLRHFGTQLVAAEKGVIGDYDHACNYEANSTWKIDGPNTPTLSDKGTGENCGDLAAFPVSETRAHLMQARDTSVSYSQVSGTKLTPVAGTALSPWNNMGEFTIGRTFDLDVTKGGAMAVERGTGKLWVYPHLKSGSTTRYEVGEGTNWNQMRELNLGAYCTRGWMVGWDDLVAVERSTGKLWCYEGLSKGSGSPTRVELASGWGNMRAIAGGRFGGQGLGDDLIALRADGSAWLYPAKFDGGFGELTKIINDWSIYVNIVGGQFNGSGGEDIIAIDRTGRKWLHANVNGNFGNRVELTS